MDPKQTQAYEWAKSQKYTSVAADYARTLAGAIDTLEADRDAWKRRAEAAEKDLELVAESLMARHKMQMCEVCLDKSKLRINANVRLPKPEEILTITLKYKRQRRVGGNDLMATTILGRVKGLSAYEVWLAQGNSGTMEDYLAAIKGDTGDPTSSTASDIPTSESGVSVQDAMGGTPRKTGYAGPKDRPEGEWSIGSIERGVLV